MKIEQDVLNIIDNGNVEDNVYFLPNIQLDRKMYLKVNKVLTALGGKWNRKLKGHLFDKSIEEAIENVILTGEVIDKKKELQFFETPEIVAKQLCELADVKHVKSILEPEAGKGSILKVINEYNPKAGIIWCELDDENASCINIGKKVGKDFLLVQEDELEKVDCVVMNPPFTKQQDIEHVTHALKFVRDGGVLVSVMSPSIKFRNNMKTKKFKELLDNYVYGIIDLPAGSFKTSGTMVNTIILKIQK